MRQMSGLRPTLAMLLLGVGQIMAAPGYCSSDIVTLHLKAQSLSISIEELSKISGHDILFVPKDIGNRTAPPIAGRFSTRDALARLLAGSGLQSVTQRDGSMVITPAKSAPVRHQEKGTDHGSDHAEEQITVIGRAERLAPSTVALDISEPTSVIQSRFIANNTIPLASVDDIIKFQPSVWTQNPNGPGIGKAETMSLRGFQDGQYNMTFDGIPFGDASDLHHTTSSLFISHFLGEAQVDRGPGTASTIGNEHLAALSASRRARHRRLLA